MSNDKLIDDLGDDLTEILAALKNFFEANDADIYDAEHIKFTMNELRGAYTRVSLRDAKR